jgi:hypothetical protein
MTTTSPTVVADEPLLSPLRIWYAVLLWGWLHHDGAPVPLLRLLRYYRRPIAGAHCY